MKMNLIPWGIRIERANGGSDTTGITRLRSEMDQLFDQFFHDPWGTMFRGTGYPAVDVNENNQEVTVTAELPGIDPKDVEIDVSGSTLTISGEKKQECEETKQNYHYMERSFGRFQRSIELPSSVDPDKVDAVYKNGTLTISLAKRPDAMRRKIEVKEG
jgi:HSP20 family protein